MKAMGCLNNCNIVFTKIWEDNLNQSDLLLEVAIDVWTKNGYMHQVFYTSTFEFEKFGQAVVTKSYSLNDQLNIRFQESGFHQAVDFCFLPANYHGIIPIDIDLQVLDNPNELARCQIRVETEPGMLERFGRAIRRVAYGEVGKVCKLNPDLPAKCIPCD